MIMQRKKLIEVALPLEAINREAVREKYIRPGNPSTLHLWWARRPLAAARAVIFAQMVDDPGSAPEEFPTPEAQQEERQRLFRLIEELVKWENMTNEVVLERARFEIRRSWKRWCKESAENPEELPPFHDPFAGGGALPLEAQRLGLEAHASDLNPVAVMINKAMIEIPPRFAGRPPVNPVTGEDKQLLKKTWRGAEGLAEDVRYYGQWMRKEAENRIGYLYPKVKAVRTPDGTFRHATPEEIANPISKIENLTVIAWLWARTIESSNPAYRGCHVPLISSFWLSTKPGKETWIEPAIDGKNYRFEVRTGKPINKATIDLGTKLGRGANFRCILSQSPLSPDYIRSEAQAGRMGLRLMAIVAEGDRSRNYLSPTEEQELVARSARPAWKPDQLVTTPCHDVDRLPMYGMYTWGDAFTPRQLVALTTFSDLVAEAREKVRVDTEKLQCLPPAFSNVSEVQCDDRPLCNGGNGAPAYADAVSVYLAFAVDRLAMTGNSLVRWNSVGEKAQHCFGRQALPMLWDFSEPNMFADATGSASAAVALSSDSLPFLGGYGSGQAIQADAATFMSTTKMVISTDPPYYDNIGYADLSDFFYVWLRRALQTVYPDLFSTLLVPKEEELVATQYRHGSKATAEIFFMDGMARAIGAMVDRAHPAFPVSIYYAFKQAEKDAAGTASTGWETFIEAVMRAGFSITGTLPLRTEMRTRQIAMDSNALASSIILVCRPRPTDAPITTRKDFIVALRRELPPALRQLQQGSIAPVDLAQTSIGPGMAVFSRYSRILESDGSQMKVRTALQLINQTLDEVLAEQEGDFDAESAWAVAWFEQFGFNDGPFGDAETLFKAKNTALNALVDAGLVKTGAGKTRLLRIDELPTDWDSTWGKRLSVWGMTHYLIRMLTSEGETAAAALVKKLGGGADTARELAYRLYSICERRKRAPEALGYNALVQSWPELLRLAQAEAPSTEPKQAELFR